MGLGVLITSFASLPYLIRTNQTETTIEKEKLTASQRQRGMYMNSGATDAGPDPNYDTKTGTWHGKRNS